MQLKNILLLSLICCAGYTSRAQDIFTDFTVTRIRPDDGLSQGSNYFRYEDSRGFMWLTGNDAVNRYDGRMIKVYNLSKYFKDCPALQQGYGFAEDADGNIYIGSVRGLYVYHRNQDRFTLHSIFNQFPDSVAMPFAYRDGNIWCFNRRYQLATYNVTTGSVTIVTQLGLEPPPAVHIYSMPFNAFYYRLPFMDEQGKIWALGQNSMVAFDSRTGQLSYPFREYIQKKRLHFFCCSSNGDKIICGTDQGIVVFDSRTGEVYPITEVGHKIISNVSCLGSKNNMIAFRCDQGIAFITRDYKKVQWLDSVKAREYAKMFNLSFDKSGRLWGCDDGTGLVIFDFTPKLLLKEPKNIYPDTYDLGIGCHTFSEFPNGNILIQHDVVLDAKTKKISFRPFPFLKLATIITYRSCTDKYRKGVWVWEESNDFDQRVKRMYFYTESSQEKIIIRIANKEIQSQQKDMAVLFNGSILCSFAEGLYWLDVKKSVFKKAYGAVQPNAFKINVLGHNRIAVSYLGGNMLLYNVTAGDSLQLLRQILPGVQSFYMQEDTVRQHYWAGTNQGVFLFDSSFTVLRYFDVNNGLAGTYIYGLLLDDAGNVYCSHQRGISTINAQTFQVINFNKNDGLQDWDFHNRAFFKASNGTLFFGGAKGFNYFNLPLQPKNYYKPEVYIDEILVNGKSYLPDTNANQIAHLQLNYNENDISIKAIVKDLGNGNIQQLLYRIAENDTEWKQLPNNSTINFNRLAPGRYTLQLGVYNRYSTVQGVQKSILITIAAPFYHKAWFWVVLAIIISGGVFRLINQQKLVRQRVKFQEQLALERQRQKITADLHDDIGASLSSLQINSAVASQLLNSDKDSAKAILSKIEMQAQSLAGKIGDIIWSMKPGKEEFMTLSSRIKNFTSEMLGGTRMGYAVNVHPDIDELAKDITVRKNIVFILKEAIHNAVKYSRGNYVAVSLQYKDQTIYMQVVDDGAGFNPEQVKGNGIGNMHHRAAELGGTLTITSTPEKGTAVSAEIPLVT